jgi:hypothetical protein
MDSLCRVSHAPNAPALEGHAPPILGYGLNLEDFYSTLTAFGTAAIHSTPTSSLLNPNPIGGIALCEFDDALQTVGYPAIAYVAGSDL